jgi:alkylhydroperoxidase family enzyme
MAAKGQKSYYDELIKEGFTEEQAIKLVVEHGMFPGRSDRAPRENQNE